MNTRKPIHELISPFDVINRIRNAVERRGKRFGINIAASLIILDDAETQIYVEYPCECGSSTFDCICDNDLHMILHNGRYEPNMLYRLDNLPK